MPNKGFLQKNDKETRRKEYIVYKKEGRKETKEERNKRRKEGK